MTALGFKKLYQEAQDEGFASGLLPDGEYVLEGKLVKVGKSQGGKATLGVMWKDVEGGSTAWENQTLTVDNPKAMAAFFSFAAKYGMDKAFFDREPEPTLEEIASKIQGRWFKMKVSNRKWSKRPGDTGPDKFSNTFSVIEEVPAGSGVAAAPAVAQPPAPPAAVLQAPPADLNTTAPETVLSTPDVAAQFAAFQAMQAAQAAAPTQAQGITPPADAATGLPPRTF